MGGRISTVIGYWGLTLATMGSWFAAGTDAATLTYHATLHVWAKEPSIGPEIAIGDIYYVQFTIDDQAYFDVVEPGFGWYRRVLTSFVFFPAPSNVGSWDASRSGTWELPLDMPSGNGGGNNVLGPVTPFSPVTVNGSPGEVTDFQIFESFDDIGVQGGIWADQVSNFRLVGNALIQCNHSYDNRAALEVLDFGAGPHPELLPPVADAGNDRVVECTSPAGAVVTLDGTGSYDMGGDDLDYEWSVAEGSGVVLEDPTAAVTAGLFPVGVHEVTLTVYDIDEFGVRKGGVDVDSVTVIVVDDAPPVALVTTNLASLWPADNKMTAVTVHVIASDACTAPNDLSILCTVSSDQPDASRGATNFTGDVNGSDGFSAPIPIHLQLSGDGTYSAVIGLRAERDPGVGSGRTYSINLDVIDDADNLGHASTTVVVPQNQKKT